MQQITVLVDTEEDQSGRRLAGSLHTLRKIIDLAGLVDLQSSIIEIYPHIQELNGSISKILQRLSIQVGKEVFEVYHFLFLIVCY